MDPDRPDDRGIGQRTSPHSAADAAAATAASARSQPAPVWTHVPIPPQAPATEGVADLPGTRLYYWDTGGPGRTVVLLHAGTQSAA
ncbi:MAG: hypothetical protein AB7F35_24845, partial [Acetobacteraceae bacterium]